MPQSRLGPLVTHHILAIPGLRICLLNSVNCECLAKVWNPKKQVSWLLPASTSFSNSLPCFLHFVYCRQILASCTVLQCKGCPATPTTSWATPWTNTLLSHHFFQRRYKDCCLTPFWPNLYSADIAGEQQHLEGRGRKLPELRRNPTTNTQPWNERPDCRWPSNLF